ncbi:GAP family protein [Streptomyces sp. NPDC056529]|uniref:GAP family protein n=1 Tax=Streptomyces sp. NPDC056529 TaxID=3345855 RepID=UPI0036B50515
MELDGRPRPYRPIPEEDHKPGIACRAEAREPSRPVTDRDDPSGETALIQAIGATLPAALAVALSSFPLIGIVLILTSGHGRRNGLLFAAGRIAGLAVLAALGVVVFEGADEPDSPSAAVADRGRVFAGAALIVLGVRKWGKRLRKGDRVEEPGWMTSLDDATAGRALLLDVLLSAANPKSLVLTASAAASIIEAGAHGTDLAGAVVAFVLIGSCAVLGSVGTHLFGGRRAVSFLDGVRHFMTANSTVITVIVMLLLGTGVLGDGLTGLGR